eukprot:Gb_20115 [translate_table: standard]
MENQGEASDNSSSIPPQAKVAGEANPQSTMNSGFPLGLNWLPFDAPSMFPHVYPAWVLTFQPQDVQQQNGGLYAVPVLPFMGTISDLPPGGLIPLSYPIPSSGAVPQVGQSTQTAGSASEDAPAAGGLQQQHEAPAGDPHGQRHEQGQREIVWRFHVGFRLDLLLILKLAVVVFVFNQEVSRDRLLLSIFVASLVYLYQTGAFAPLLRWLYQSVQRPRIPPRHPARALQGQQAPNHGGAAQEDENVPNVHNDARQPENEPVAMQQGLNNPNGVAGVVDEQQHPNWWGIMKEVQMIVVGFVASLLPGFHPAE